MNLLLDTNVFIDYLGRKEPFFADAEKVIVAGCIGDVNLWVSTQTLKDAYYVLSSHVDQKHVQRAIRHALDVVHPIALSADDSARGLFLEWDDYEDCLISLCAAAVRADYILTRDVKGFERSSIPALRPAQWLESMRIEHNIEYDAVDLQS